MKLASLCRGQGETRQRDRPLQVGVVGGGFTKQKQLTYGACTGQQNEWIPAPTIQILKVYKEALTGFSHIYHAGVANTTSLSQAMTWEQPLEVGEASLPSFPAQGGGEELPSAQSSSWVNW